MSSLQLRSIKKGATSTTWYAALKVSSLFFCLCMATLRAHQPVFADLAFKKQVIENCEDAVKEIQAIEPQRRDEIITDLKLLLKLQTTLIQNPKLNTQGLNKLGEFDAPLEELRGTDIWTGFQPTRNIRAKRCAVQIVALLSPYSIETAPEMILLLGDSTLPYDLRLLTDETVTALTIQAAHDPSTTISNDTFRGLIDLLSTPLAYKSENALIELREKTVKFLISEIRKPDAALRDRIADGLLKIDDHGELIGDAILDLLASGDDGLRKRAAQLLSELEQIYPRSVPALIERLNDLSPEVETAALDSLSTIFDGHNDTPRVVIDGSHLEMLLRTFERQSPSLRKKLVPVIVNVGPLVPDYYSHMLALLKGGDALLRAAVIEALGKSPGAKPEALQAIFAGLKDSSLEVRLRSIEALGNQGPSAEIIKELSKLLNSNAFSDNPESKQRILLEVSRTVAKLRPGPRAKELIPYLVEALYLSDATKVREEPYREAISALQSDSIEKLHSATAALVAIGRDSVPACIKALEKKDRIIRVRAATVLALVTPPDARAISALVTLLKDSELSEFASLALSKIGQPAVAEVRRLYRSSTGKVKLTAAKVLFTLGETESAIVSYAIEGISEESCKEKAALASSIRLTHGNPPVNFVKSLLSCLSTDELHSEALVQGLLSIAPLPLETHAQIISLLTSSSITKKSQLQLLEQASTIGLTETELLPTLLKSLQEGDKSLQFRVLNILKAVGPQALDAVPTMLTFIKENKNDPLLANEAVLAIARIDQNAYDYTTYFLRELQGDEYQWAQKSILKLPRALTIPVLERALTELPQDKLSRVVDMIAELDVDAKQFVPKLLNLINAPDARLRYIATIALLRVDPENPSLTVALRRELLGEFRKELLNENLSESAKPILESIVASSNSYVERKIASMLLERLR